MEFHLSRLRRGELIAAAGALALLVLLLAFHWYGARTGWQALSGLRWLALVTILAAFALAYFQAARRAPALPAALSVIVGVLALITALWLAFDLVLNHPPHQRVWAFVGLIATCVVFYGGFRSLRQEGVSVRDERADIPTITAGTGVPS
jgi:drug/metabolite transporter (DMT)-like permease